MYRIYIKWVLGKIIEIPCVGLALECLVDHWSNPLSSLPPRLATSPPSQRNLPRHSLALVEDARKIAVGPWLCIIKPAPLYMSFVHCKICPVIITSEQSRFNHVAKPHVRYLRSRPGPWLPQSADWPLAHHCLF